MGCKNTKIVHISNVVEANAVLGSSKMKNKEHGLISDKGVDLVESFLLEVYKCQTDEKNISNIFSSSGSREAFRKFMMNQMKNKSGLMKVPVLATFEFINLILIANRK
jgi:hypothetical protein